MMRVWILISLVVLLSLPTFAQNFFVPGCKLPFTGKPHAVDGQCGNAGLINQNLTAAQRKAEIAQNKLKNELCRSGTPTLVTIADLAALQAHVDALPNFPYGNPHAGQHGPPDSRTRLKHIALPGGRVLGEGDLVMFTGFLVEAHYTGAESVNCEASDQADVDIHLALGEEVMHVGSKEKAAEKNPKLCKTITAEAIPHFRPAEWERQSLEQIGERRVRITGQLFFDGSHHPRTCTDLASTRTDPVRAASWEIHPIYSIEVCRTGKGCDPARAADWEALPNTLATEAQPEN